jgi:hypothetical protein
LLFAGNLKMAVKVRGGVMSINGSTNNVTGFELDMRDVLRAKKARDASNEPGSDYSSLISRISAQSVHEIDHLIDGLRGVREKLNRDGDRLHNEIAQHTALSQAVIQLTEIVSDSVASVNKSGPAPKDVA